MMAMTQAQTDTGNLLRIERKVDRLADAVEKLVLIEERQTTQGGRLSAIEQRVDALAERLGLTDRKVDMWINRGVGAWAIAATLFALLKTLKVV